MNKIIFILPLLLALLVSVNADAKKKKYPNGDYYEGKMKKDQPNGFGKMYYANGDFYEGEWVNGVINGKGRLVVKNKVQKNREAISEGIGKLIPKVVSYNIYEGIWRNGSILEGKMSDSENNVYEGTFVNMDFSEGKMTYASGGWANGTWENGKIYCGDSNGNIGDGIFNGKWVNGKFVDGYCSGNVNDKFSFIGQISNSVPLTGSGKGELNGNTYDGKWENGKFSGKCKLKFANSNHLAISSFEGIIDIDGSMDGIAIYNNGDKYRGKIKNSQRNGKGSLEMNRPIVTINGEWSNDKLLMGKGYIVLSENDYSFTIGNSPESYKVKVKNPYNYQASFQLSNEVNLEKLLSRIEDVVKNELLLTEERVEKYKQIEDTRIQSRLNTYRGENYKIAKTIAGRVVSGVKYLYNFGDVEYQYYPTSKKDILYGNFHAWNGRYWGTDDSLLGYTLYSAQGKFRNGIKVGLWTFEERSNLGRLKRRLVINYKNGVKHGPSTLETYGKNGSKRIIRAYYDNDHWGKNGHNYYYYDKNVLEDLFSSEQSISITERNVSFDANGQLHGDIYMREDDVELRETYNHGRLVHSEKRNIKKGIVLSRKRGENRFKEMWKLILPASFPGEYYNYRVDNDPLVGMTFVNFEEESEYDAKKVNRLKEESMW